VGAGISQTELGRRLGMSGDKIWQLENDRLPSLSIVEACEIAAVVGLDLSVRSYPNGAKLRDAVQMQRLLRVLAEVGRPLTWRLEVCLPRLPDRTELRAWDALIEGAGQRTGVELESRLTDIQATFRQHNGKRRDDPVDNFLLLVADTRSNRRVLEEFPELLVGLPRLRTANVVSDLRSGKHPGTGVILV
jgi:transcriptional regulator with XRE-family HTH domain